jgi:adenylosuccinate synthase
MLDLDYGTYPYVTSSSTTIGGVMTGLGITPFALKRVVGVIKAYTTRVGGGPFPTEDTAEVGNTLQEVGAEWGTTTGRRRRCGWLDLVVMRYSTMINGYTELNLTKLDVLDGFEEIKVAVGYKLDGVEVSGFPGEFIRPYSLRYKTDKQPTLTDLARSKSSTRLFQDGNPTSPRSRFSVNYQKTAEPTSSLSRISSRFLFSTLELGQRGRRR